MRAAALALLLALPLAGAQGFVTPAEVDTTLYLHVLGPQDMPINTQEPEASHDGGGQGLATHTLTCAGQAGAPGGLASQPFHTFYGYSSPSLVEYGAGDGPRVHPERGLAHDVPLVGDGAVLHWYMAASSGAPDPASGLPSATPNVRVAATVRAGDGVSVDDKAYDSGEVLMEGATLPATLAGPAVTGPGASQVTVDQADDATVYGFRVPLALAAPAIPRATGFTLRIDVQVDNPACTGDGQVMTNTLAVRADPAHRPRIELRNGEPLRVHGTNATLDGDRLLLRWIVTSAWGNYDVDARNATLEVFGPAALQPRIESTVQRTFEHGRFGDPVDQTWSLPRSGLADGHYTAIFRAPNLQHTATAEARLSFTVQDGRLVEHAQSAPSPGWLALAALLGLAALLRRRQP